MLLNCSNIKSLDALKGRWDRNTPLSIATSFDFALLEDLAWRGSGYGRWSGYRWCTGSKTEQAEEEKILQHGFYLTMGQYTMKTTTSIWF